MSFLSKDDMRFVIQELSDSLEELPDGAMLPLTAEQSFRLPSGDYVQVIVMEGSEAIFNREVY